MSVGDIGGRIDGIRKEKYKSVDAAVSAMNKAGFNITANQLYELQSGQWPTRIQLLMLSDFFGLPPEFILFGIDGGPIQKLTTSQRETVERLIKEFAADNEKLSPPPR